MNRHELSPKARNLMVSEVLDQSQSAAEVCRRYNVSRVTLYKWIKRHKSETLLTGEASLINKERVIERYWHQAEEKYEQAVLALVGKNPEWGIRTLVKKLPVIADKPILGHHGVQNVLKRHNLSTFELRSAYAGTQKSQTADFIGIITAKFADMLNIDPQKREKYVSLTGVTLLSAFITLIGAGTISYISAISGGVLTTNFVGQMFSLLSLSMGTIFFLYSFKYYFTLAIVLSYSQKDEKPEERKNALEKFFFKSNHTINSNGVGLRADMDGVTLKSQPFISVHIPFFNEKNVVERAIRASTGFKYQGEYEVILCDDSTDETSDIITKYQKDCLFKNEKLDVIENKEEGWSLTSVEVRPGVTLRHLHRTTRHGFKGAALDLALKIMDKRTEYVSVFDADFVPYPDTLDLFLKYFQTSGDQKTGVVQGYQWHVLNKSENWITRGVRSEYSGSYVIERSGAEIYGGLKQISGSVYMIKRKVLEEIGWGTSITEDFELTLRLYEKGYKVLYTPYIQAPAECVSTLKRLIRQRMRWAEGHSFNVKKMFKKLMSSPNLTKTEKFEFIYLTPYYLQAFFFLVGTLAWLISETIFKTHLPFWTEVWGWSLILTNMVALPLVNGVGLFLEESEEKDYFGMGSFIALSYIVVPFQAYAAVKGFIEKAEGPWFRTPKTGRITDIFARTGFMRFVTGIIPGRSNGNINRIVSQRFEESPYLALTTANNKFDSFEVKPKGASWIGNLSLAFVILISFGLSHFGGEVKTGNIADYPIQTVATRVGEDTSFVAKINNPFIIKEVLAKGDEVQKAVSKSVDHFSPDNIVYSLGLLVFSILFALIYLYKRKRNSFRRFIKIVFVSTLLTSWILTGSPVIWESNWFRFPPKINEPKAAAPSFVSCGTMFESTAAVDAPLPSGISTNDILLLFIETGDQSVTVSNSNGGTWTEVTNSPQSASGNTRLTVFWSRYNGTQGDPTVSDSINHQIGAICAYSGVHTTGDPWDVTSGSVENTSTDATLALAGATTTGSDRLVVIVGAADDDADTPITGVSNANLSSISSARVNAEGAAGNDGGLTVFDAVKTTQGDYGTTTLTYTSNTTKAGMTIALKPPGATAALTGTATQSITESDVVTGSKTLILTLTGDTWVASGATFDAQRQNIIDGLDSAQSETAGWNNEVRDNQGVSGVVRTSSTVVTITLDAQSAYDITAQETITVTIPGSALSLGSQVVASPTFTVDANAIVFTNQGASATPDLSNNTDAASYDTGTWSPPTSGLIMVYVYSRYTIEPVIPTVTGNSLTWTLIRTTTTADHRLSLFAANGSGATSDETTISFNGQVQIGISVSFFSATGVYLTDGVQEAFVQMQVGSGTGTSGTINLNTATDSNNRPIAGFAHAQTDTNATTPRANWTEADELGSTGPLRNLETQYREDAMDSAASATNWTSSVWLGIAAEVRMVSASTPQLEQTAFRIRTDDTQTLSENTTGWAANLNTNASLIPDEKFRIRFEVDHASGGSMSEAFELWYSRNGAEYQPVPDNPTPFTSFTQGMVGQKTVQAIPSASYSDLDATTNLLAQSSNTFVAGTGNHDFAAPSVSFSSPSHTEFEWTLLMRKLFDQKGHNPDGTTFAFRVRRTGGGVLKTYSQTATVTILNDPGHIGGATVENPMRYFVVDGNKNLYYLTEFSDTQNPDVLGNSPCMMKSTDGGVSWNAVGVSSSSDEGDLEAADMDLRGNTIYITMEGPGNGDAVTYWEFNVSTHGTPDVWAVNNELIEDNLSPVTQAAAIAQRSATTVVAYGGATSGSRDQIWYAIKNGTWGTPARLDTEAGKNFTGVGMVRDSNDIIHIVYSGDNNSTTGYVYLNTLSTGNVLGTRQELFSGTGMGNAAEHINLTPPFIWNDGAVERVGVGYRKGSDGKLYFRSWPANDITTIAAEQAISDSTVVYNQGGNEALVADIAADDTLDRLHSVFGDFTSDDVFYDTRDTAGSWGTDLEPNDAVDVDWIRSQLFTHSGGNGGNKVLGYVWDNGSAGRTGFTEYSEKIITRFNLAAYRFFANDDSTNVGASLAAQDNAATMTTDAQVIRLRLLLNIGGSTLATSGENFKVQIAQKSGTCDVNFSGETYSDLLTSSGDIRYYNNDTPTDGSALTNNANDPNYTGTEVNQTYEESNNFTNSVSAISANENGKWDITIEDNAAVGAVSYCVRVVRSDGGVLDTYTVIPEFTTVPENPILLLGIYPVINKLLKKFKKKNKKS